jgi:hypothetical protein
MKKLLWAILGILAGGMILACAGAGQEMTGAAERPKLTGPQQPHVVLAAMKVDLDRVIAKFGMPDEQDTSGSGNPLPSLNVFYKRENLRFVFLAQEGSEKPAPGMKHNGPWSLIGLLDKNDQYLSPDEIWKVIDKLCLDNQRRLIESWK